MLFSHRKWAYNTHHLTNINIYFIMNLLFSGLTSEVLLLYLFVLQQEDPAVCLPAHLSVSLSSCLSEVNLFFPSCCSSFEEESSCFRAERSTVLSDRKSSRPRSGTKPHQSPFSFMLHAQLVSHLRFFSRWISRWRPRFSSTPCRTR